MSYLTPADLITARSRPQSSKLYLSIYQPEVVFKSRVMNASGTWGDSQIFYSGVSYGFWSGTVSGQTLLVGSTDGGSDYGKVRLKSATGTSLIVAMNDDVYFGNGAYLTVIDYHELFPVYTMIAPITDPDVEAIFYPDGDIVYSDQSMRLGSLINMGGHYAGFTENPVYYSASGTVHVKGEAISSYLWKFGGGNPATSTSQTPGNVTYATPGHYTTELSVISASGTVDYSYRHISIYNHSTQQPIESWGITSLQGSRDEGGYTARLWINESISYLVDGALIVIWSDDTYGSVDGSLGSNALGRDKILFSGYVSDNSIKYDSQSSRTEFEVSGITLLMKKKSGFSISVASSDSPARWQEAYNLNVKRALYYFYRWNSTLLQIADLKYIGEDLPLQYLEMDMDNLYDGINTWLQNKIVGKMVADRQGIIYVEPGIEITNNAIGVYPICMTMEKQDWMEQPAITVKTLDTVSSLEMGGYSFSSGSVGSPTAYLSQAPGGLPSYSGSPQQGEMDLIVTDQNDLNRKTGNKFAYLNARYPEISMKLAGQYRNIDIAPYEQIKMNIQALDTNYGIVMIEKPYHPMEISYSYDAKNSVLIPNITIHEITQGFPAVTEELPVSIIDNYIVQPLVPYDNYDFSFTPWELNPPAVITPPATVPCDGLVLVGAEDNNITVGGLIGTYESSYSSDAKPLQSTPVSALIRPSSVGITKTTYKIDGSWMARNMSGTLTSFAPTLEDDFYHVYLIQNGVRVAEGTHDAVDPNNPNVRTGYFDMPTGIYISNMEIALDEQIWDISSVTIEDSVANSNVLSENLVWDNTSYPKSVLRLNFSSIQDAYYIKGTILIPQRIGGGSYLGFWFQTKLVSGGCAWTNPDGSKRSTTDVEIGRGESFFSHTPMWSVGGLNVPDTYVIPAPQVFQYQVDNAVHPQQGVYVNYGNWDDVLAGRANVSTWQAWEITMLSSHRLVVNNFRLYDVCGQSTYQNSSDDSRPVTNTNTEKSTVIGGGRPYMVDMTK